GFRTQRMPQAEQRRGAKAAPRHGFWHVDKLADLAEAQILHPRQYRCFEAKCGRRQCFQYGSLLTALHYGTLRSEMRLCPGGSDRIGYRYPGAIAPLG